MNTLRLFAAKRLSIEAGTAWFLNDLGELRGQQELYTRQSPQRLKALRESAVIESALSSNRIEGVEIDPKRVRDILMAPRPLFRDRDEEEVRGYRDALNLIHQQPRQLPINNATIQRLHTLARGEIWDAGQYKERDGDIIERYPDGSERVRFKTVSAADTPTAMEGLVHDWAQCLEERWVPRLQPGFFMHSPVPRRQRTGLAPVVAVAELPAGLRGGALHQPGTPGRREQGALLPDPGAKLTGLA